MDVPEAACTKRRHMQIAQSLTKLFFAWLSERAAYYSESPKHSTQLGHASNSSSDTREIEALPFFRQTFCPIQMAFYRFSDHNKSSCIIRMKSTMLISNHIRFGSISICVELLFSYTFPSKAQYRNFTFLFFFFFFLKKQHFCSAFRCRPRQQTISIPIFPFCIDIDSWRRKIWFFIGIVRIVGECGRSPRRSILELPLSFSFRCFPFTRFRQVPTFAR